MFVFWQFLEFGDVLLELVDVQMLTIQPIVSFMKGYAMIEDLGCNENQPNQIPVPLRLIEFEFIRFHVSFLASCV